MKTRKTKSDTQTVKMVFEQLKTGGYTDSQIVSFAAELTNMAQVSQNAQKKGGAWLDALTEYDLSLLGMPRQG